jgi:hypothetical protein
MLSYLIQIMNLISAYCRGVIREAQRGVLGGEPYLLISRLMYYFRLKKRPVHLDFDVLLCSISSLRE